MCLLSSSVTLCPSAHQQEDPPSFELGLAQGFFLLKGVFPASVAVQGSDSGDSRIAKDAV